MGKDLDLIRVEHKHFIMRGHQPHRLHKGSLSRLLAEHAQRIPFGRINGDQRAAFIQNIKSVPGIESNRRWIFQLAGSIAADFFQEYAVAAECLHPAIPAIGDEDDPGARYGEILSVVELPLPPPPTPHTGPNY